MKVLGYEFREMTEVDYYGLAGAEPGSLVCYVDREDYEATLVYDPATKTLSEITYDAEGEGKQVDWKIALELTGL